MTSHPKVRDLATTRSVYDGIACPWCGYVMRDLWDHDWKGNEDESMETECGDCEKPFVLTRVVSVHYVAEARPA